ncbi:MAG TPA: D-aminoacylase [Steroidobacteraceae bacterium]|jgi:N-acyl-D-amino-acid deacylase|nr:D-aminoacylase [Steroidobacteraceae bacterium]
MRLSCLSILALLAGCTARPPAEAPRHDLIVRGGTILDGSGSEGYVGDVVVDGDRIVYVGKSRGDTAASVIDATGKAVSPGFINMLSWAVESLIADGRSQSDLRQGVTLEVFGEGDSLGPLTPEMKKLAKERQVDIQYDITWTSLGEYLEYLQARGIAPNVASFLGAATTRINVLGEVDVDPTPAQLEQMKSVVRTAMEEGALGIGSSLIYAPGTFAETDELVAISTEAARCGGSYITHMRSEGDRLLEAVDETIEIARRAQIPAEIYHLKAAGRAHWNKIDEVIARIDAARAQGLHVTTDMYTYTAGATGLDAAMPTWVQDGGLEAWIQRLKDPKIRERVVAEMRAPGKDWENLFYAAGGAENILFIGFKNPKLKPLTGKRLSEVAAMRGTSPEDTAIDLVIEDGTRVDTVYFLMSEDNVRKQIQLPYMSFGSDAESSAPEGVFLQSSTHPRAYGNFARLLGRYVRDEKLIPLPEAVRRLTSLPAGNLALKERGLLKAGYFADIVVFDPTTIQDHASFEKPQQFATGVSHVVVNGGVALSNGEPTGEATGRVVRGQGWKGWPDGGCRASAKDWPARP